MGKKKQTESRFYFRYANAMTPEDRLDYSYWHPKFDSVIKSLSATKLCVDEISSLIRSPIASGKTPEDYVYPMRGVCFIGARNVADGKVDLSEVERIEESVHNGMLKNSKVNKGDALITMAGTVGRCALYQESFESNINQAVARIQLNVKRIDPDYAVYFLNSSLGQAQFERNQHQVDQPNINATEIGRIRIVYPRDPTEQIRVARTLNRLRVETEALGAKRDVVLKKASDLVMQELGLETPQVKKDYYARDSDVFGERIDFVWNHPNTDTVKDYLRANGAVSLGSIITGEIEYGVNDYGKEKGKIPFVNVDNLGLDGRIHTDGIGFLDEVKDSKRLREEDLLISRSRTVGTCSVVSKEQISYTFGSYILRFRIDSTKKVNTRFVADFINSEIGQAQIIYLQTGSREAIRSGGNNINPHQLKQLQIVLPKDDEHQKDIVEETERLFGEKNKIDGDYDTKIREYRESFQKLLDEAEPLNR